MKIKFNEKNFISVLQKGGSTLLVLSMLSSFSGCDVEMDNSGKTSNKPSFSVSTTVPNRDDVNSSGDILTTNPVQDDDLNQSEEPTNSTGDVDDNSDIYNFSLLKYNEVDVKNAVIPDWENIEKDLREKIRFDQFILGNEESSLYGICADLSIFNSNIRIIDSKGTITEEKVGRFLYSDSINERYTLLCLENKYVIFDHMTGEKKEVPAKNVAVAGGFLKAKFQENNRDYWQLLYPNGSLAIDGKYGSIVCDSKTNYFFLGSLESAIRTEIVDLSRGKATIIEGRVEDAYNNYLIVSGTSYALFGSTGVGYLEEFGKPLLEKISNDYSSIEFSDCNSEIPMVICMQYASRDYSYYLGNAEEGVCSAKYGWIYKKDGEEYYQAYKEFPSANVSPIISYIDNDGKVVLDEAKVQNMLSIPGRDAVIFQECSNDGNYGIMDFDKNIIVPANFSFMYIDTLDEEQPDKFAIVGLCGNETVIYDRELKEVARGKSGEDFFVFEVVEEICNSYDNPKRMIKTNN